MTIRRVASLVFLFLGGFCVGMQVMIAFLAGGGALDYALRLAYFTAVAAPILALGAWLSPGQRWRELGLTMLIGAGVCGGAFSSAIFLPDEHGVMMDRAELTPYLALGPGFANLTLIAGAGLLLYLRGGDGRPTRFGRLARGGIGEVGVFVRASLDAVRRK
jgi:hypothetical protein